MHRRQQCISHRIDRHPAAPCRRTTFQIGTTRLQRSAPYCSCGTASNILDKQSCRRKGRESERPIWFLGVFSYVKTFTTTKQRYLTPAPSGLGQPARHGARWIAFMRSTSDCARVGTRLMYVHLHRKSLMRHAEAQRSANHTSKLCARVLYPCTGVQLPLDLDTTPTGIRPTGPFGR